MELISPTEFAKDTVQTLQDYSLLAGQSIANLFRYPRYFADMLQQADLIGVGSLPIVVLTGFFTGAVLALNSSTTLQRFGSLSLLGQLVSVGMVRELGPVLTGLMVAGRNSSGMASELGSMVVTEQIDAMRALGTDPTKKLVTPRVVSTVFMLFFLTIISDLLGLVGGGAVARLLLGMDSHQYWSTAWQILTFRDVFMGLVKPLLVRIYHFHRRLLLRNVGPRWHPGRGQGNHSGSGCVFGVDPAGGLLRDQVLDGDLWVPLNHGRTSHSDRTALALQNRLPPPISSCSKMCPIAFDEKPVLDGISFRLAKGETKAIFGVAGSGKSTILKLALGLMKPDAGHIYVLGDDVTQMSEEELFELRRRIGMVFQESALFDSLTVRENVAFRLLEEGDVSEEEVEQRVREALSFVELEDTVDMFPSELSGGMRRRVAIARAIITQPEILLYDSPTGGLDPVTSTTIIQLIVKQRDVYKTSSLLVTHRLQDAFIMATHYFDRKANEMRPLATGRSRRSAHGISHSPRRQSHLRR